MIGTFASTSIAPLSAFLKSISFPLLESEIDFVVSSCSIIKSGLFIKNFNAILFSISSSETFFSPMKESNFSSGVSTASSFFDII